MKFLNSNQVGLRKNNILVNKETGDLISNDDFFKAQTSAHSLILFAELSKGKKFSNDERIYTAQEISAMVSNKIAEEQAGRQNYFETTKVEKGDLTQKLADEALAFINGHTSNNNAKAKNDYMQQFNIIREFEDSETGVLFTEGVSYLSKIYTIDEIIEALDSVFEILLSK